MRLVWSTIAKKELRELRHYSIERWGRETASRYFEDLRDAARSVASRPDRVKALNAQFRILRVRSHYLILRVDPSINRVTVARILHTSMDIERHLP